MKNSTGTKLWEKAKRLIPGGNQLLSKKPEHFLPGAWPVYYSKAKGCEIWDLDGRHFYDFAQMGVGACVLGYADEAVNAAVIQAIEDGSMATLNCPEEVELAERLIALHPWAEMARFSRTGGEACTIAIRIARAATGKTKIAFCGYHGWHDWYLSANLGDKTRLDGQLLPGLDPLGVPRQLKDTAFPFNYNDIESLKKIIGKHGKDIAAIVMEPVRNVMPENNFLHDVRKIATQNGAVLIFDEITSGFRMNLGGIHRTLGVDPDIAIFGKALGNGFSISLVIGRREVMQAAQNSFISSTFWTERVGFVAALATLKAMESREVQPRLVEFGKKINEGWRMLSDKHDLPIQIQGIPPLTHLAFKVKDPQAAQTLYTQEMLEKGYLVGAAVYTTAAYTDEIIHGFLEDSDKVFATIKQAVQNDDFKSHLKGEVAHAGFKRLA